jgi:amino acid permease
MAVLFFTGIKNDDQNFFYYKLIFMTAIMIIFYLLSLQKDLSRLRFTYYACVISVFYLIFLLFVLNCFLKDKISNGHFEAFNSNYSTGLPLFILVFSCQVNMVQVFNVMEKKNTKSILLVSFFSSLGGVVTYFIIGFLGYKLFGAKANGLDMVNIFCDKNSILNSHLSQYSFIKHLPSFAVIGAMVVLTGSFPLQINPAVSIFVKLIGNQNEEKLRISVISVFCLIIYVINLYPRLSLSLMLGIVGAIFSNALCFLFPGIYYLTTCRRIGLLGVVFIMIMGLSILAGVYILYTIFINK